MVKTYSQFISENTSKRVVMTWGRFNPPHLGHKKIVDAVAKIAGSSDFFIYGTQSHDEKRNPLAFNDKLRFMRSLMPQYAKNIIDHNFKDFILVFDDLNKRGYTDIVLVVGSDRLEEFKKKFATYNGVQRRNGMFNFNSWNVVSGGQRDPDADDNVSALSSTKVRELAALGKYDEFASLYPSGYRDVKKLYDAIRRGMKVS